MAFQSLDALPLYEQAVWENKQLINRDAAVKWSGNAPPPAIGAEIIVTINNCGRAIVTGYFIEDGWLGVQCRLLNAPEWHRKQNNNDPNGCVFGAEMLPA